MNDFSPWSECGAVRFHFCDEWWLKVEICYTSQSQLGLYYGFIDELSREHQR